MYNIKGRVPNHSRQSKKYSTKEGQRMTQIEKLADEYNQQYNVLCAKMDALKPLLCVYRGQDLYLLRKRIKIYYDMACECKRTASLLSGYYEEDLL
ncbi:MAG: hypothetical protein ACLUFN_02395 [Eubacterium sp.]